MDNLTSSWGPAKFAFLTDIESRTSANNRRFRESRLNVIISHAIKQGIALHEFGRAHLQAILIERANAGIAENTRYHDYQTAKMFFAFVLEEGFRSNNPLLKYKMKHPAEVQIPQPSKEDLSRLLIAFQTKNDPITNDKARFQSAEERRFLVARERAITMLLVDSGARIGEILNLTTSNYDPDKKHLVFMKTKNKKIGYVPITDYSVQAVADYQALRPAKVDSPYMFISRLGDKLEPCSYGKLFGRYVQWAGLKHFTLHSLRHYSLSKVAEVDLWAAVGIARHEDARTTQHYIQHVAEHIRAAHTKANVLGEILGQQPEPPKGKKRLKFGK